MRTAAKLLVERGDDDWVDELERLADRIESASPDAKRALRAAVESFREEPVEGSWAVRLLARAVR